MSAVFAAVVMLTPMVKTDWVSVTPTTPSPSTGMKSSRRRRLSGSTRRRSSQSSTPAKVNRTAAKSTGGTLSTTCLTATKLVPKKKTARSSEVSSQSEALRFSGDTLADEVRILLKRLYVGGDQTRAALEVLEVDCLVGRVHVAVGARDEPRRNARASELDRVSVRPRRAGVGLEGISDARLLRGGDQTIRDDGAQVRGPLYDGSAPEGVVPVLVLGDPGCIRGVGDVHGYGHVGVEAECGAAGAVEPYLLLHARHRHDFGGDSFLLREQAQGFEGHEGAHPVVE